MHPHLILIILDLNFITILKPVLEKNKISSISLLLNQIKQNDCPHVIRLVVWIAVAVAVASGSFVDVSWSSWSWNKVAIAIVVVVVVSWIAIATRHLSITTTVLLSKHWRTTLLIKVVYWIVIVKVVAIVVVKVSSVWLSVGLLLSDLIGRWSSHLILHHGCATSWHIISWQVAQILILIEWHAWSVLSVLLRSSVVVVALISLIIIIVVVVVEALWASWLLRASASSLSWWEAAALLLLWRLLLTVINILRIVIVARLGSRLVLFV